MWRWMVATVAPKRIGPTPCPAITASRGPPGTGQLVRAAGATNGGGDADAAAALAAAVALGALLDELEPLLQRRKQDRYDQKRERPGKAVRKSGCRRKRAFHGVFSGAPRRARA